jgi:hypothetical protein
MVYVVLRQIYTILGAIRRAKHCGSVLQKLPQEDPADDSDDFYLIQIPVEENNVGDKFKPKLPHLLLQIPQERKLAVVKTLTAENEVRLSAFFERIQSDWRIPLERMRAPSDVDNYGKIFVKYNRKTEQSILAKV